MSKLLLSVSRYVRALTMGRLSLVGPTRFERARTTRKMPSLVIVPSAGVSPFLVVLCCHVVEDVFGIVPEISEEELDVSHIELTQEQPFLDADAAMEHLYTPTYMSRDRVAMLLTTRPLKAKNKERKRYDVYGLAVMNWGVSVVSTAISVCVDPAAFISRKNFTKVVIHEVGHMLNLDHCESEKCVMNEVRKAGGIDGLTVEFCDRCLEKM